MTNNKRILYFLIALLLACFSACKEEKSAVTQTQKQVVPPKENQIMTAKLDSFLHAAPQRLDLDSIAVSVYDLTTGFSVFAHNETESFVPASCMKIATALCAIQTLGLDHNFSVTLQARGEVNDRTLHGNLMLVADTDPMFESFDTLALQLKENGIDTIRGNVYLHLEKEDTLRAHSSCEIWDITYKRLPVLLKGKKRIRQELLYALNRAGISIQQAPVKPMGKKDKYRIVARSRHSLHDILIPTLTFSSNIKAESLLFHMDYKAGLIKDHAMHWGTFQHITDKYLDDMFFNPKDSTKRMDPRKTKRESVVIGDGSGLSHDNRMTTYFLNEVLKVAYADETVRNFLINEGLAAAGTPGRCGSLKSRMGKPENVGRVFMKTGTLNSIGVSSLAGYLQDKNGHWYAVSIFNMNSPIEEGRQFQDRLCEVMLR